MRAHKLKIWPVPFVAVESEDKVADVRCDDRDFQVGDYVMLAEYHPIREALTGKYVFRKITHITTANNVPRGLIDGFVILHFAECSSSEEGALLGNGKFMGPPEWLQPKAAGA